MTLEQMEVEYERRWSDRRRVEHDLAQTNNAICFMRGIFIGMIGTLIMVGIGYGLWRFFRG